MITVFGSIGADLVTTVRQFPAPGETVVGTSFAQYSGGKGANQALAAARAGASVYMFGAVGTDDFAAPACALLAAGGVNLQGVKHVQGPTGIASILVSEQGQNCIAVVAGANGLARAAHVPSEWVGPQAVVVMQHECPHAENMALASRAQDVGSLVILNAAPARPLELAEIKILNILIVNESEAEFLAEQHGMPTAPEAFARSMHRATGCAVVVTLGKGGVTAVFEGCRFDIAAPTVDVVDTTGAGDAFVGAFAAAVSNDLSLPMALTHGIAAGSIACTAKGAQMGLPFADVIFPLAASLQVSTQVL